MSTCHEHGFDQLEIVRMLVGLLPGRRPHTVAGEPKGQAATEQQETTHKARERTCSCAGRPRCRAQSRSRTAAAQTARSRSNTCPPRTRRRHCLLAAVRVNSGTPSHLPLHVQDHHQSVAGQKVPLQIVLLLRNAHEASKSQARSAGSSLGIGDDIFSRTDLLVFFGALPAQVGLEQRDVVRLFGGEFLQTTTQTLSGSASRILSNHEVCSQGQKGMANLPQFVDLFALLQRRHKRRTHRHARG